MRKRQCKIQHMFPDQEVIISTYSHSEASSTVDISVGSDANGQGATFSEAYVDLLEYEISRLRVIIQNMKEK